VSAIPHALRPPAKLAAPAIAAAISAASFGCAFYLANVEAGIMAILPSIIGLGSGLTASIWLRQSWRYGRGSDRQRRAVWIGATALLLVPLAAVVGFVLVGLVYAVVFVRP